MPDNISHAALLSIAINPDDEMPAYVQLYQQFRELILTGVFAAKERLPATRTLAKEIGLSRTTVNAAYDQLTSEGYIQSRRGAGAFVTEIPPDHLLQIKTNERTQTRRPQAEERATTRSNRSGSDAMPVAQPFLPFAVAFDQFPQKTWARLLGQSWRVPSSDFLLRADPFGHLPLRQAIADHLRAWRGIDSDPDNILITCGISDALDIILRAIPKSTNEIWIEDPGFAEMQNAIIANGYNPVSYPVDEQGLDVARAVAGCPNARAAIITPSRQFPLAIPMSLSRRLALLNWARQTGSWVIEDDFDSEYRFSGHPISPLMTLDEHQCVFYLGSFSKVMLRSLRLGYIVVPPPLTQQIRSVLERHGSKASLVAQPALAQFIASGDFAAYIRKTRRIYASRLAFMSDMLSRKLGDMLTVNEQTGGLHLIAEFTPKLKRKTTDIALSAAAKREDLYVPPLSEYYREEPKRFGLLLGFAGFDEDAIATGVNKLAKIIRA